MLRVIVHVPGGEDRKFRLTQWRTVVGRSRSCDLTLVSSQVSKTHAAIEIHDGNVTIRDLGSRNGTEVNSVVIDRQSELQPGDLITFGDVTITIDPESAIFQNANPQFHELLAQERALRSKDRPVVQPERSLFPDDPTRMAIAEAEREASALIARPIAGLSGGSPILRVLELGGSSPRTEFRIEPFKIEMDDGEPAWIQPSRNLAVVSLDGFQRTDDYWFDEPEDKRETEHKSIILRHFYMLPTHIRVFEVEENGVALDGIRIYSERTPTESIAILPARY